MSVAAFRTVLGIRLFIYFIEREALDSLFDRCLCTLFHVNRSPNDFAHNRRTTPDADAEKFWALAPGG